ELVCVKSSSFLAPLDSPDHRKYAPDRDVEILHVAIDVTPDFKQRTIQATAVTRFRPNAKPTQELKLDAVDLRIGSVSATEKIRAWQISDEKLRIPFEKPTPEKKEATVTTAYPAEPRDGLSFRTPEMGYPEGDTHLFSQGEKIEARHWYPCFDSP